MESFLSSYRFFLSRTFLKLLSCLRSLEHVCLLSGWRPLVVLSPSVVSVSLLSLSKDVSPCVVYRHPRASLVFFVKDSDEKAKESFVFSLAF